MPMIQLTLPAGVLAAETRGKLQKTLAATLLKWEGAPDTAFFRALAWSRVDEVPEGGLITAEDELPRFRVDATVPQGALSDRRKEGLIKDVTADVLTAAGLTEADALRVWVLIHEQPEGTWGAGGQVVRFAEVAALAKGQRA
ncbi:tautomerase family protein [Nocardia bhagyanarayanae]|uniref:Phenylpyruvate tautomerase PptA (4-oxalocrotonate tautomerase family) n=1 Tax=Nocardia bhagyanarayanae TaxID=1215925 RepID=A0A543FB15_9NOCA|nr:tautomerase family protein [Nocardia bhagyanarayanae]TQM31022.1 phenylpyruvate tautomerase PptA (4-oxalocrotonate tautomerase family) [Nocardia bhagyanarayanae]